MVHVAWTGHRPFYFAEPDKVRAAVFEIGECISRRHRQGVLFVTGGQLGVDLWAAEAAAALEVPFEICLPLPAAEFTREWSAPERALIERLFEKASSTWFATAAADRYGARNQRLVDTADRLEVVWAGLRQGGTWDTVQRARRAGRTIRFHRFAWSGIVPGAGVRGI